MAVVSSLVLAVSGWCVTVPVLGGEAPRPVAAVAPPFQPARPYWLELTPPQREALAPLTTDWEHLDYQTKKKWVEIANRYPRMKPEERSRTQERMREWAMLTPEQRRVARDSFERVRSMPPEQRADMLRRYQELPPEKRAALTHQGTADKGLVVPKAPAAVTATAMPRRLQIREGTTVRNPAVAAQKSASPANPVSPAVPPRPAPARPPEQPAVPVPANAVVPVPVPAAAQPVS